MPKSFLYLILVWTIVILSGLGIFLFQMFGPRIDVEPDLTGAALVSAIAFFIVAWAIPVGVLVAVGRRQKA